MAPKFCLDEATTSNFDAALVLATMLVSQLQQCNPSEPQQTAATVNVETNDRTGSQTRVNRSGAYASDQPSDHTRIWSELSGSGVKSGNGAEDRHTQVEKDMNAGDQRDIERIGTMQISKAIVSSRENMITEPNRSQHHPSNWIDGEDEGDEDGDGDDNDFCVQSTPPYCE